MSSTSGRSGPSQQGERMDRHGWDLRYQAQERVFGADPSGFLGPEVGPLVPGRALDLGCGEGRNASGWPSGGGRSPASTIPVWGWPWQRPGPPTWPADRLGGRRPEKRALARVSLRPGHPELRPSPGTRASSGPAAGIGVPAPERDDPRGRLRRRPPQVRGRRRPTDADLLFTVEGLVADLAGMQIERAERLQVPAGASDDGMARCAVDRRRPGQEAQPVSARMVR